VIELLIDNLPRVRLAHLPTPLERMPRLGASLGIELWIKRDDCTGLAFGGNKSRKLEFAIGEALAAGADTLIAASGYQSNFVRQSAAAAAKLGLEFHAVVAEPTPGRERHYFRSGNLLLDHLFNANLHVADNEGPATDALVAELSAKIRGRGRTPWRLLFGASQVTGAIGYVNCARELLTQCPALAKGPSTVFVVTGGGGGQAGLLAGFRSLGTPTKVIGISCSEPSDVKCRKVKTIIAGLVERFGNQVAVPDEDIVVLDAYAGAGYAIPTDAANSAIRRTAAAEGIVLEPVYTGKGMAGIIELAMRGDLANAGPVIFIHSGGTPALFVYDDLFWKGLAPTY
jgi:L-cysteate sulfo-lyase